MSSLKTLSPAVRAAIQDLYKPDSLVEKLLGSSDRKKKALEFIATSKDRAAIPFLLPVILAGSGEVRQRATSLLRDLSAELSSQELVQLDPEIRQSSPYMPTSLGAQPGWYDLKPFGLDRFKNFPLLLGLISFHSSGYVREAAVHQLGSIDDGIEIPFLLIRLNDWVINVREAAMAALKPKLRPKYAASFVANLDLVQRLTDWKRADHLPFVESVFELLKTADGGKAVTDGLTSKNVAIRRICYRLAVTIPGADVNDLLKRASHESDLISVLWGLREARSRVAKAELRAHLERAWESHFMPVRRESLTAYCEEFPEESNARLEAALMDRHSSMREFSRHGLTKKGVDNFAERYRTVLQDKGDAVKLYAALGGIGETGSESDCLLIEPYLANVLTSVRKMALRSLAKLCAAKYVNAFVASLSDKSPGVSRMARNALLSQILLVPSEKVWSVLNEHKALYVQRHALSILAGLRKWDSLPYLLRIAAKPADGLAPEVERHMGRWLQAYNQSFSQPTKAQLENIRALFTSAKANISERQSLALGSLLASVQA